MKRKFAALAALFSFEFLSRGLFANGPFSRDQSVYPASAKECRELMPGALNRIPGRKTEGGLVLEGYSEPTPQSDGFLTAQQTAGNSIRSFVVNPSFFRIILSVNVPATFPNRS
jgi:hypothetical protein